MKRSKIGRVGTWALTVALAMGMITGCGQTVGKEYESAQVAVGSLKGATSIGLMQLMEKDKAQTAANDYEFTMAASADELLPLVVKGELDIALVPANVAAVLYQKTSGGISVIDINTLGVLYLVSGNDEVTSMEDLPGKTIYLTGKGTSPDYVLHYLLSAYGMTDADVTLEYKSEATEVAALLAEDTDAIGLLPQPFVTAACMQNDSLEILMDMTEEWEKVQGETGSSLVTGVTIVTNTFLEENKEVVDMFLKEHEESAAYANENPADTAILVVEAGIVTKEAIAEKAIPQCHITCIKGVEMKQALVGYLEVLFEQSPEAVGGSLPDEAFYYLP